MTARTTIRTEINRVTDPISEIQLCISEIGSVALIFFVNFGSDVGSDFGSDDGSVLVRIWCGFRNLVRIIYRVP